MDNLLIVNAPIHLLSPPPPHPTPPHPTPTHTHTHTPSPTPFLPSLWNVERICLNVLNNVSL